MSDLLNTAFIEEDSLVIDEGSNEKNRSEVVNITLDLLTDLDDIKQKLSDEEYLKIVNKVQTIYKKCKFITNFDYEQDQLWEDYSSSDQEYYDNEFSEESQYICELCNCLCCYIDYGKERSTLCKGCELKTFNDYVKCKLYKLLLFIIPEFKYFFRYYDDSIDWHENSKIVLKNYDELKKYDSCYIEKTSFKLKTLISNLFPNCDIENLEIEKSFISRTMSECIFIYNSCKSNAQNKFDVKFLFIYLNFTISHLKYYLQSDNLNKNNDERLICNEKVFKFAITVKFKILEFMSNNKFLSYYKDYFVENNNDVIEDWKRYMDEFLFSLEEEKKQYNIHVGLPSEKI